MMSTRLLVVRGKDAAVYARELFPEWDVRSIGSALAGAGFDLILVTFEPIGPEEIEAVACLETHVLPGGVYSVLERDVRSVALASDGRRFRRRQRQGLQP